ncbi:neurotrypsin-like [Asterias amurensis]|uniref:neurotrypsin-like n=1 Tax=Asterias amurensis TaxID=7602 RepID=UPI003AB58292
MSSVPVATTKLLLCALLSGFCIAYPVSVDIEGPYVTGPPCISAPLGMENGAIPDAKITASSYYSSSYYPRYARLNDNNKFWRPSTTTNSWIQVDLGLPSPALTGVIVQGTTIDYVKTFSVQYSQTGSSGSWKDFDDEGGNTLVFNGNDISGRQATVSFPVTLRARFLRLLPITWNRYLSLDFEVFGCRDGIVRLVGGDDELSGRVEIYHDDGWGAVCDTNWDFKDATTVCRQLGYIEASEAKNGSFFGGTQLPTVMDRVACRGTEPYISECSFVCDGFQPCNSTAGVVCKPNTIRLAGESNGTSGRVEIYKDGYWGAICDNDWDITDAGVACRQLGFAGAEEAKSGGYFSSESGPIRYMHGLMCDGSEAKITDCPSRCWDEPTCNSTETAGVVCLEGTARPQIGQDLYTMQ